MPTDNQKNYIKNLTRSLGRSSVSVISDLMPHTRDLVNDSKDMVGTVFDKAKSITSPDDGSSNGNFKKTFKKTIDNALQELKTGNIYTEEKEKKALFAMAGDMGDEIGSALDEIEELINDDDDDSSSKDKDIEEVIEDYKEENEDVEGLSVIKKTNNRTVMRTITNNVKVGSTVDQKITNQLLLTNIKAITSGMETSTSAILNALATTNNFHEEVTREFYNDTSAKLASIYNSLNKMTKIYQEVETNNYKSRLRTLQDNLLYSNSIVESLKETWKYNSEMNFGIFDIIREMGPGLVKGISENPMGMLMKAGITGTLNKWMPGMTKAMNDFDDTIGSLPVNFQYMMQNWKGSDNKIKNLIADKFGINTRANKKIDTGRFEKGAIAYNGIANRAIVNVIPSLLSKILSAVTDNENYRDELVYDYDKGRFTNQAKVRENTGNRMKKAVYDSTRLTMEEILDKKENDLSEDDVTDLQSAFFKMASEGKTVANYEEGKISKNAKVEQALRNYIKDSRNNNRLNREVFEATRALQNEFDSMSDSRNIAGQVSIDYVTDPYGRTRQDIMRDNKRYKENLLRRRTQDRIRKFSETVGSDENSESKSKNPVTNVLNTLTNTFTNVLNDESDKFNQALDKITNFVKDKKDEVLDSEIVNKVKDNKFYNKFKDNIEDLKENIVHPDSEHGMDDTGELYRKATKINTGKAIKKPTLNPRFNNAGTAHSIININDEYQKQILDNLNNSIKGSSKFHVIIDGGSIESVKRPIITNQVTKKDINASYSAMKAKSLAETEENESAQDDLEANAEEIKEDQEIREEKALETLQNMSFEEASPEYALKQNVGEMVDNLVDNSGIAQKFKQVTNSVRDKIANSSVGGLFITKSMSTPQDVTAKGMTPVWIMGSNIGNSGLTGGSSNSPLNQLMNNNSENNSSSSTGLGTKLLNKSGTGLSKLGNLGQLVGSKLSNKGGTLGTIGNILTSASDIMVSIGNKMSNVTSEEAIAQMQMKRAELRENAKDKLEESLNKVKEKLTLQNENQKMAFELKSVINRENFKMVSAKLLEKIKKPIELLKTGVGNLIDLAGRGIKAVGTAISGIPIFGKPLAIAGITAGAVGLGATVAALIKKFKASEDGTTPKVDFSFNPFSFFKRKNEDEEDTETDDESKNEDEDTETDDEISSTTTSGTINNKNYSSGSKAGTAKMVNRVNSNVITSTGSDGIVTGKYIGNNDDTSTNKTSTYREASILDNTNIIDVVKNAISNDTKAITLNSTSDVDNSSSTITKKLTIKEVLSKKMIPVWIMGSNVNTSNPAISFNEMVEEKRQENQEKKATTELNEANAESLESISENIRGLVRGFTSLFSNGISGLFGSGSSSSSSSNETSDEYTSISSDGDTESQIWNFFKSKGLSDEATSAVMGNIYRESRFKTGATEGGGNGRNDSGGYGLIQWTGGRRKALFDAASEQGVDVDDLEFQLNYLWSEVFSNGSSYQSSLSKKGFFDDGISVNDATQIFHDVVERSADTQSMIDKNRKAPANEFYNKYSGTTSATAVSSSSGSSNSVADSAVAWAIGIADDDSHGYSQDTKLRWGSPDYDCSSLVISAYEQAGLPVKTNGAGNTSSMYNAFIKSGFTDVTSQTSNGTNVDALEVGDVLLTPGNHTEMYVGDGKLVGAHSSETGGKYGTSGDQTGNEISVKENAGKRKYTYVLRAPNKTASSSSYSSSSSSLSSSSGATSGLGVFDSTYAVSDTEKAHEEIMEALASGELHYDDSNYGKTFTNPGYTKLPEGMSQSGYVAGNNTYISDYDDDTTYADMVKDFTAGSSLIDEINNGLIISDQNTVPDDSIIVGSGGIVIPNGNNTSTSGTSSVDTSDTIKITDVSDGIATTVSRFDVSEYWKKLIDFLENIVDYTSYIPKNYEVLNNIYEKMSNSDGSSTTLPNVNTTESIFNDLDSDIQLIASGI